MKPDSDPASGTAATPSSDTELGADRAAQRRHETQRAVPAEAQWSEVEAAARAIGNDLGGHLGSGTARRDPPTIDLPRSEFSGTTPPPDSAAAASADAGAAADIPTDTEIAQLRRLAETAQAEAHRAHNAAMEAAQTAATRRGAGVGGLLGAALIGAAATLATAAGLWRAGVLDTPDPVTIGLDTRLQQLDARVDAATKTAAAGARANAATADPELTKRLAANEQTLAAARRDLDGLTAQLGDLKSAPRESMAASAGPDIAEALRKQDEALRAREAAQTQETAALNTRLAALEQALGVIRGEVGSAVSELKSVTREPAVAVRDVAVLTERVSAMEQAVAALRSDSDKRAQARTDAAQSERSQRAATAAAMLDNAVQQGRPYATELSIAQRYFEDASRLAPLATYAASGVPTTLALSRELVALAAQIRPAPEPLPANAGLLDRLQAQFARLVRVRSTRSGSDATAGIARIEAAAARGDLAAALAEIDKLPDPPRAKFLPFVDSVKAREAALAASRKLAGDALTALDQTQR